MITYQFIMTQLSVATQMGAFLFLFYQVLKRRVPYFAAFAIQCAIQAVLSLVFLFFNIPNSIQTLLQLPVIVVEYKLFFDEKMKKILPATALLYVIAVATSMISALFITYILNTELPDCLNNGEHAAVSQLLTSDILMIIIFGICYFLISRKHDSRNTRAAKSHMPIFVVIMAVHYALLIAHYQRIHEIESTDLLMNYIFQAIIIISLYMQYFSVCGNVELMEKNYLLSMEQLERKNEKRYYELAQSKYDEISKVRHDLVNHLNTAIQLMKDNHQNEAQEIMENLQTSLDEVKVVNYCTNTIINTILTTKANQSEYAQIDMQFLLKDCDKIPCDSSELCSLISNLFDNAAKAALESGTDPLIYMESGIVNEFFVLKVTNTARKDAVSSGIYTISSKNSAGHGYGLLIIQNIAKKYDGSFELEQKDVFVTGTVTMKYRNTD